jgi:hypothetical protein
VKQRIELLIFNGMEKVTDKVIRINLKNVFNSLIYKYLGAITVTSLFMYSDFATPMENDKIIGSIIVNVLVLGFLWIWPSIFLLIKIRKR